ncbi:cell division protein FtsL [Pajaroellobacter abortibovis]|uniref:Cell division protein FtsL n=1 Tax=Pajaroellobacter abortibovis TaxID=1882918 RepID=A0A1L6MVV6_9BACT|nr:cell division protein FtsL [Pajaroellobacter abortibovis]APR99680.1 hypothetical protein BCY86_02565 [Pajaroellobacter abortibovis]
MRTSYSFLFLWTLAVFAAVSAFVFQLSIRSKIISIGYELGRTKAEQEKLKEAKRVLQVETGSYRNPERIDMIARGLLGMESPPPERIIPLAMRGKAVEGAKLASEEHVR